MNTTPIEPLRVWRARRDLTQQELANLAGVSRQTVTNVESGLTQPSRLVRRALSEALGAPTDSITELAESR